MLEELYEQVLIEESIKNWIFQHKDILKQLGKEFTMMGLFTASPVSMGIYVSSFLEKNFPNLPEQIIGKIAQFIADNPQILELLK